MFDLFLLTIIFVCSPSIDGFWCPLWYLQTFSDKVFMKDIAHGKSYFLIFFFNLVLVWEDYNCNFDEFPGRLSGVMFEKIPCSHIFLTWNKTQLLNGTIGVLRCLNSNCFPYHGNWMQRQILSSNTMFDWPLVFRCKTNLSPYPLHDQWCISPWCKTNNIHYIGRFLWQSTCKRPPIGSFRTNTFTYSNTALITLLPTRGHHVRHCDAQR